MTEENTMENMSKVAETKQLTEEEFRPNKHTLKLERLLVDIIRDSTTHEKEFFLVGGFALDIFGGKYTRNHGDIDAHPLIEDISWWKEWFRKKGFNIEYDEGLPSEIKEKDRTKAFVAYRPSDGLRVDFYGVEITPEGRIFSFVDGKKVEWAGTSYQEKVVTVDWKGLKVNVLKPEAVLWSKKNLGKQRGVREKDLQDYQKYGIQ